MFVLLFFFGAFSRRELLLHVFRMHSNKSSSDAIVFPILNWSKLLNFLIIIAAAN